MSANLIDAIVAVGTIAGLYLICLGVSGYQVVTKARKKRGLTGRR